MGSRLHGSDDCAIHVAGGDAVCFNWAVMTNALYYGDNLDILREHVPDESVDLVYLDPPFNSNASYNVLFKEQSGEESPAQIRAFNDTWQWTQESQRTFENEIMLNPATPANVREMVFPPVHRQQRHDGLPGDDDAPAGGAAPRPQAHRLHLPPLRPHREPLPQGAHGRGVWQRALPK